MFKSWFARSALIVCLLCSSAFTCSLADLLQQTVSTQSASTNTADSDFNTAIQAVINENIHDSNTENLPAYMATIHPDSPGYAATESALRTYFADYDLDYTITLGEATLGDDGDARISFVLTTRKIKGGAFRDNEVTGTFIMRLDGTQWKIFNQEFQNIRYLG